MCALNARRNYCLGYAPTTVLCVDVPQPACACHGHSVQRVYTHFIQPGHSFLHLCSLYFEHDCPTMVRISSLIPWYRRGLDALYWPHTRRTGDVHVITSEQQHYDS